MNLAILIPSVLTGVLALLGIIAITVKVLRAAFRVDAALPTLLGIAHEFSPNSGHSLKDHVTAIRVEQEKVSGELIKSNRAMADHIKADADAFAAQAVIHKSFDTRLGHIEELLER